MTSKIIVNTGAAKSPSAHTPTPSSTSGTSATLTPAGEPEWSNAEDNICWAVINTMEHFAPNWPWPSAVDWRERYSVYNASTPPQGRTEDELGQRCITLVDQRHAERLALAQAKGDGSLSAVAQQPKSPAPQLNVTLPKLHAPKRDTGAGEDAAKGEGERKEGESSKEQSEAGAEKEAEASSPAKVTHSKPAGIRKSITKKIKAARCGRKQASLVLKGNFESFKVKNVGRRSKIITFKGKGTIRVQI